MMAASREIEYLHHYGTETSLGVLEAERLRLFNTAYAPFAFSVLEPYLAKGGVKVLELAVGTGAMGGWIAAQSGVSQYIGVDKDPSQLEKAAEVITGATAKLIVADALHLSESAEFLAEKPKEGFNLIYCRWFLCHIQKDQLNALLSEILPLLAIDGVFICEEPDHRNMHLKIEGARVESETISAWKDIVKGLQAKPSLGLDLEMDAGKLTSEITPLCVPRGYRFEILCSFQPELTDEQKYALVLGLQTAKRAILSTGISEEKVATVIRELDTIAKDPKKTIVFYTNTFGKITKTPESSHHVGKA